MLHNLSDDVDSFLAEAIRILSLPSPKASDITRISEFDETIRAHTGEPFRSPHLQTGGPALGREDLSRAQIQAIRSRYDEDWRAFGSLFA